MIKSRASQDRINEVLDLDEVVTEIMSNAKYLPKVIEYDRYQPEFYEDTYTYIKKRSSSRKIKEGLKLLVLMPS